MKKFVVLLAVLAMVFAFTAEAMADASVYGSARFRTYWQDVDPDQPGVDSDGDVEWRIGHLTRFGVKFAHGDVTGHFELDARAGQAGATDNIEAGANSSRLGNMRLRLNYGEWNFGAGKLMVGQNYPLFNIAVSGVNYNSGGLQPWGGIAYTDARTSQIRLTFGNLKIAFLPPDTSVVNGATYAGYTDVDTMLPKIELEYDLNVEFGKFQFIGGYQNYSIDATVNGGNSLDVTSYVLAAAGKHNFGAAYFNWGISYRLNGGPYDCWTSVNETPLLNAAGTDLEDTTTLGFVAALGFKLSDMTTLEVSYSKLMAESDLPGTWEDDAQAFAFMAKFTMAPGVYIIPEFLILDNEDIVANGVSTNQTKTTVLGVFWRIDFK